MMFQIPAGRWNGVVNNVRSGRPIGGMGVEVLQTYDGSIVTANPAAGFHHPWELGCFWYADAWCVAVRPGFVNGVAALIAMPDPKNKNASIDVAITTTSAPYLTASWRNPLASAGIDENGNALAGEGYPAFFKKLGVRSADSAGGSPAPYDPAAATRTRELRACDVVLSTPRLATAQQVDIANPLTDAQTVTISTTFQNAVIASLGRNTFHLSAVSEFQPLPEPTALDRLMGTAVEPQVDQIKLATLWIVSPPDPPDGQDSVPDASWTCYPQYNVFWNLNYATLNNPGAAPLAPITLQTGLIGGLADSIFSALLSPTNDANAAVWAFLNASSFKGQFYTI